jgi:hypothetical protein
MFSLVGTYPQLANVETMVNNENVSILIPLFFSTFLALGI